MDLPRIAPFKLTGRAVAVGVVVVVLGYFLRSFLSSALDYVRVGPKPAEGNKVVVLLHGYGASGDDLVGLAAELEAALPDVTFLMPKGPHRVAVTGRAGLPQRYTVAQLPAEVESTTKKIWDVIDYARHKGALCRDIYVGGFSQGGWMAAEVALRAPPDCPIGGVIIMSGGGVEMAHSPATGLPRMRVLVTHGTQDRVVAPVKGRATAQHFAADHDVQWLEFEGPHGIPPAVRAAIPGFLRGEMVGVPFTVER